ncbi:hypothetical protein Syn7502_00083 [Synechococcus sp. PCC 7502]|uniref:DUF6232 family protein n=1 Tax=Synechococcus sp. PCC 7502 TaxID=1173263 RepID=UPI00029FC6FD|nr:DUF6232 family protein [Synechococcus sp. PCC 7502]AFY72256.1 hypothetical protein Syn7502_00083 [Synechococcus sp. PCC 7502]
MTNRDIAEQVYYDQKRIRVTNKGIDIRGEFYPFFRINKYAVRIISPDRKAAIAFIASGILLLIVGIGIIFLIAGVWQWVKQKPAYWLVFETDEIKDDVVYQTYYKEEAEAIHSALNVAIANGVPT